MKSVPAIQLMIDRADQGQKPQWEGTNGMDNILTELLDLVRGRGIMEVADLTALALIGGADAQYVVVEDYGIYKFDPDSTAVPSGSVVAYQGGLWRLVLPVTPVAYTEVIGDGAADEFVITHNLSTLFPTVLLFETGGGLPYSCRFPGQEAFSFSVASANAITLYSPAPLTLNQMTVVVKK